VTGSTGIVIVGDWLREESLRGVHTVRSLLQTDRVAGYVTDLPPLAASVLAALPAALARSRRPPAFWRAPWERSATADDVDVALARSVSVTSRSSTATQKW
jgi:hypothetical protein